MKYTLPILGISTALLFSCGASKKASTQTVTEHIVMDTLTVSAKNNPLDIYRATTPLRWQIAHTRVALSFNFKEKTANGREWITMHPYNNAQDTVLLDAKTMKIDSVCIVKGKTMQPISFQYADDQLRLKLDKSYTSRDSLQLYIRYTAMPYEAKDGGSAAITEDRGLYFINTDYKTPNKPTQIWTQGETEANSHWMVTFDKPNQRSTFQIELSIPDSFQTLSNGAMTQSTKSNGMRTDIWRMDMPIQVYAAMFAIGKYTIVKDEWKGKEVNYYVEEKFAPSAKLIFNNTPEMIGFFSDITGVSYPWNKYDQVIARDYVSGAMENTTASLFGEFVNQNAREIADNNYEDVVSHELFHQWFGDYVTAESWSNVTVNESFANYGEYLWRKHKYGAEWADQLALADLNKYLDASAYNDPTLVRFYYRDKEDLFDRISYEKGGATLHYLNALMGDSSFYKAMRIYLTKNALHPAEATNWRLAVEEATGEDWNWFFNQWYLKAGHPKLDISYAYNDSANKLVVTVIQKQADSANKPYKMPLKAAVIYGNNKTVLDWTVKDKKEVFSYPYQNGVKPVFVPDAAHWLPGEIVEHKLPAQWLVQFKNCDDYISKQRALKNTYKVDDSSTTALFELALNDKSKLIRKYALNLLAVSNNNKWIDRWRAQVMQMAVNDANNNVRAAAFSVLSSWKVGQAKPDMVHAVNDSSYFVAGEALTGINALDKDTAYVLAKSLIHTDPQSTLRSAIFKIIGDKANGSDIDFYATQLAAVSGAKKFEFASSLVTYLKNVKEEEAFEKGIKILGDLSIQEAIPSYRSYLSNNIFMVGKYYKDKAGKTDNAQKRLDLIKQQGQRAIDAESDADAKKSMEKQMKDVS